MQQVWEGNNKINKQNALFFMLNYFIEIWEEREMFNKSLFIAGSCECVAWKLAFIPICESCSSEEHTCDKRRSLQLRQRNIWSLGAWFQDHPCLCLLLKENNSYEIWFSFYHKSFDSSFTSFAHVDSDLNFFWFFSYSNFNFAASVPKAVKNKAVNNIWIFFIRLINFRVMIDPFVSHFVCVFAKN